MRSLLALSAALAAFAFFLARPHLVARQMIDREEVAAARIPALAQRGEAPALEEGGYRFRWLTGSDLPAMLLAEPVDPGADGLRSFAWIEGHGMYVRDPTVVRPVRGRDSEEGLRRYLALEPRERAKAKAPPAWEPHVHGR